MYILAWVNRNNLAGSTLLPQAQCATELGENTKRMYVKNRRIRERVVYPDQGRVRWCERGTGGVCMTFVKSISCWYYLFTTSSILSCKFSFIHLSIASFSFPPLAFQGFSSFKISLFFFRSSLN